MGSMTINETKIKLAQEVELAARRHIERLQQEHAEEGSILGASCCACDRARQQHREAMTELHLLGGTALP
jgi:hypothetical protein